MTNQTLLNVLKGLQFFHDIDEKYLEQVASVAVLRDVEEHSLLFREGDVATHVYFVVSGRVSLDICAAGIGCRRILTIGSGEPLAWSALLQQSRLTATARALTQTQLVVIDASQLLTICQHNPQLGFEIMRRTALALAARLSATRLQLLDVYGNQPPQTLGETKDGR